MFRIHFSHHFHSPAPLWTTADRKQMMAPTVMAAAILPCLFSLRLSPIPPSTNAQPTAIAPPQGSVLRIKVPIPFQ